MCCKVRYIDGDITAAEYPFWSACFEVTPDFLEAEEKNSYLLSMKGVSISSDAFFPFRLQVSYCSMQKIYYPKLLWWLRRDSIDHASKVGVSYVVQPGGSVADEEVHHSYTTFTEKLQLVTLRNLLQVKAACKEYKMTMIFTGLRLFLH